MRIVKLQQRSREWYLWRSHGIGSSDIAAICGKCPYRTPYQVWEKLMGFRESDPINQFMQRGIDFEDEAREYLGDSNLKPECVEHDNYNYFHASLDGLGNDYFCEIKVPSPKNFTLYEKFIPEYYILQVQWQLLVSGLDYCKFLIYSPEKKMGHIALIYKDEVIIDEIERVASKFWSDYLKGIPPELTEKDVLKLEGIELHARCLQYEKWYDIKKRAEEELEKLKKEIVGYGEGKSFQAYGIKCIKTLPRSSYDYERMKADGIDLEKYKKVGDKESFMLRMCEE